MAAREATSPTSTSLNRTLGRFWSAPYEARLELAPLMAVKFAVLMRLLRTPGASGAAATAQTAAPDRHGAVLRLMRAWTQYIINTLRPTLEKL